MSPHVAFVTFFLGFSLGMFFCRQLLRSEMEDGAKDLLVCLRTSGIPIGTIKAAVSKSDYFEFRDAKS